MINEIELSRLSVYGKENSKLDNVNASEIATSEKILAEQNLSDPNLSVITPPILRQTLSGGYDDIPIYLTLDSTDLYSAKAAPSSSQPDFHALVKANDIEKIKIALAAGGNPNLVDNDCATPLSLARSYGYTNIVQLLEQHVKQHAETDQFYEHHRTIKEAGHFLGFDYSFPLQIPNTGNNVCVRSCYNDSLSSVSFLAAHLQNFTTGREQESDYKFLDEITQAFALERDYLRFNGQTQAQHLLARYKSRKITTLPTSWVRHDIGLALYKNYLIITNRATEKDPAYVKIYKLSGADVKRIDEGFIQGLRPTGADAPMVKIMTHIEQLIGSKEPLTTITVKSQKIPTCSVVNRKSMIQGLLFVKKFEKLGLLMTTLGLTSPGALNDTTEADLLQTALGYAKMRYKHITRTVRDSLINKYLNDWKATPSHSHKKLQIYLYIFTAYILNHAKEEDLKKASEAEQGQPTKNSEDLERARRILAFVDQDMRDQILDRLKLQHNFEVTRRLLPPDHREKPPLPPLSPIAPATPCLPTYLVNFTMKPVPLSRQNAGPRIVHFHAFTPDFQNIDTMEVIPLSRQDADPAPRIEHRTFTPAFHNDLRQAIPLTRQNASPVFNAELVPAL